MTLYDSDSSGDEGGDYTETEVLLGYASQDATEDSISHIGGHPQWLDDRAPAPGQLARCKVCNSLLSLLIELNGDLPERFPGHERRLYLWGCRRKPCRRKEGSFRAFRAIRSNKPTDESRTKDKVPKQAEPSPQAAPAPRLDLGSSIFGGARPGAATPSNPFAAPQPSSGTAAANPFASASSLAAKPPQRPSPTEAEAASLPQTFADKVKLTPTAADADPPPSPCPQTPAAPPEPWPPASSFPPPYPLHYLDADYEALQPEPAAVPQQTRLDMDIDNEGGGAGGGAEGGGDTDMKEAFESSMDRAFQRFADRVAQNPEQVLRYEFGGVPLLYSRDDSVGRLLAPSQGAADAKVRTAAAAAAGGSRGNTAPRCGNCGAARVFELQLMPRAIEVLEEGDEGLDGMDWGTVVMLVCERDCAARGAAAGEVGYVEEWVGVQWEELAARR